MGHAVRAGPWGWEVGKEHGPWAVLEVTGPGWAMGFGGG